MRKIHLAVAVLAATTALSGTAYASGNGTASAVVVTPLAIAQTAGLSFGAISSGASSGTVDTSGATTGGTTYIPASGAQPGAFSVSGVGNQPYTIVADPSVLLTTPASDTMTAALTADAASTAGPGPDTTGTLSSGSDTISVTGVLTVAANQPAGNYNGSYNVAVHY